MSAALRPFRLLCAFAAIVLAAASCTRVSRERTLPPSIRSIDVPMFVNRTAEPAIEEDATIYTQEEFLADGRLDLVREGEADAIVAVELVDFTEQATSFDSDDFPRRTRYTVAADVRIYQNIPGRPQYGPKRTVSASRTFINDPRRLTFEAKGDGQELVLRDLSRRIVRDVLTGGVGDYVEGPQAPDRTGDVQIPF